MKQIDKKSFLLLHATLLLYSLSTVCSKMASSFSFLSAGFVIWYSLVLAILFVYAILWQQVLKKMPLTLAFSNKAVTIIWGLLWGVVFFGEAVTIYKVLGIAIIVLGIYLVVSDNG